MLSPDLLSYMNYDKKSLEYKNKKTAIELSGPTIPDYIPNTSQVGYGYFSMRHDETTTDYTLTFTKPSSLDVVAIDYDTMRDGKVAPTGTDTTYWDDNDGFWSFTGNTASLTNFGFKYSEEDKTSLNFDPFRDWIGKAAYNVVDNDAEKIAKLLINGYVSDGDDIAQIAFGLTGLFAYQVDEALESLK